MPKKREFKWNNKCTEFLINNYKIMSFVDIGKNLGLSDRCVRSHFKRLGLKLDGTEIRKKSGCKKDCKAWNKGMKGELSPFYGIPRSNETKKKMSLSQLGEKHYNWKGGKTVCGDYEFIRIKGKKIRMSHYVWMNHNKFYTIPKNCVIHHKDLNKLNNNIDNLILLPRDLHSQFHWVWEKENNIKRGF